MFKFRCAKPEHLKTKTEHFFYNFTCTDHCSSHEKHVQFFVAESEDVQFFVVESEDVQFFVADSSHVQPSALVV